MTSHAEHALDINQVYGKMSDVKVLLEKATNILECRIEEVLDSMSYTPLCDLPDDEPITLEEFIALTDSNCKAAAQSTGQVHTTLHE